MRSFRGTAPRTQKSLSPTAHPAQEALPCGSPGRHQAPQGAPLRGPTPPEIFTPKPGQKGLVGVPRNRAYPTPRSLGNSSRGWGLCFLPAPSPRGPRQSGVALGPSQASTLTGSVTLGKSLPPLSLSFLLCGAGDPGRSCPAHPGGGGYTHPVENAL